jgi:hypothetical protein
MRALVPVLVLVAGCSSDHEITLLCSHDATGFDIEDVSVLQDGQGYGGMHDAVILEFDDSTLPEGATWRVRSVDIMPIIPRAAFNDFVDGETVSVEVFDGDDPDSAPVFTVSQPFDKNALEWTDTTLEDPYTAVPAEKFAWWTFDFTEEIPTSGLESGTYMVGVVWEGSSGHPPLGYSNFNRPCDKNWTDYADGAGWVLNGATSGDECSWPMLRVQPEVLQEQASCDGGSAAVE